jgi:hypothetical protein
MNPVSIRKGAYRVGKIVGLDATTDYTTYKGGLTG